MHFNKILKPSRKSKAIDVAADSTDDAPVVVVDEGSSTASVDDVVVLDPSQLLTNSTLNAIKHAVESGDLNVLKKVASEYMY